MSAGAHAIRAGADEPPLAKAQDGEEALLIVDEDAKISSGLAAALRHHFDRVCVARDADGARALAKSCRFDFLIADFHLSGPTSAPELVGELWGLGSVDINVIFVGGSAGLDRASDALPADAADFLRKPFQIEQLLTLIKRARDRRRAERENYLFHREADRRPAPERMIGESEAIREVRRLIERIAPMPSTVLLKGETGTGKELAARALHDLSDRRGSYVPLNCAAISAELFEGELFGHFKGAFTGAHQARQGLFGHADGGTLFMDEIGEMPLGMQAKLLRVLDTRRYRPVGGNHEIPVNARVIVATNRDLAAEVLAGRFRKDLYYRINVIDLHLPALRERKTDIARLARLFLKSLSIELGVSLPQLDAADLEAMVHYEWPGNIRELRNVIERSLLLAQPISKFLPRIDQRRSWEGGSNPLSLEHKERTYILEALRAARGNKTLAAHSLGISRKTIERRLRQWGIANLTERDPPRNQTGEEPADQHLTWAHVSLSPQPKHPGTSRPVASGGREMTSRSKRTFDHVVRERNAAPEVGDVKRSVTPAEAEARYMIP